MVDPEAEKSISIAERAMQEGNYEKAKKFLLKSINIQKTEKAMKLLKDCESSNSPNKECKEETKEEQKVYSDDDTRICEEILNKTDYYQILNVPKTASDEEIKKQYKKLALKLHPDKNRAPQATEAFKKISQAFACLNDKNKRAIYDEHGSEQNFRQQYSQQFNEEDDPFDMFEMFFTGNVNRNRRRGNYARNGNTFFYSANQSSNDSRNGLSKLIQFLPILLIIAVALMFQFNNNTGNRGEAIYSHLYSLSKESDFRYPRLTSNIKVKYYVRKDFSETMSRGINLNEIEREIEQAYMHSLYNDCHYVMQTKQYIQQQMYIARRGDPEEYRRLEKELKSLNFASCNKYQELSGFI